VAMPAGPGAHLVLVQTDLAFSRFEQPSMVQRVPATRTRSDKPAASGASVR
jgi:hypothetical protein